MKLFDERDMLIAQLYHICIRLCTCNRLRANWEETWQKEDYGAHFSLFSTRALLFSYRSPSEAFLLSVHNLLYMN